MKQRFTPESGRLSISMTDGAGLTSYYLSDGLGSTALLRKMQSAAR